MNANDDLDGKVDLAQLIIVWTAMLCAFAAWVMDWNMPSGVWIDFALSATLPLRADEFADFLFDSSDLVVPVLICLIFSLCSVDLGMPLIADEIFEAVSSVQTYVCPVLAIPIFFLWILVNFLPSAEGGHAPPLFIFHPIFFVGRRSSSWV